MTVLTKEQININVDELVWPYTGQNNVSAGFCGLKTRINMNVDAHVGP